MCRICCLINSNKLIETDQLLFMTRTLRQHRPVYEGLLFFGTAKNITTPFYHDETIKIGITLREKKGCSTYMLIVSEAVNAGLYFILLPALNYYGTSITTIIFYIVNVYLTYKIAQRYVSAKYDLASLIIFFVLFILLASTIPLLEINKSYLFPLNIKVIIFVLTLTFPFIFKFIITEQNRYSLESFI